jgi:hypothetical protein
MKKKTSIMTLRDCIRDAGEFYSTTVALGTEEGRFLAPSLKTAPVVRPGDILVALAERAGEVFGADRLAILPWRVYKVASVKDGTMEVRWVASTGEEDDIDAVKEATLAVGSGGVLTVVGELAEEFRSRDRACNAHVHGKGQSTDGGEANEKENKTVMESFNGKSISIAYTDKTKLAERLVATRMVRRVMCGRMWRWLSANGIDIDMAVAWKTLVDRGRIMANGESAGGTLGRRWGDDDASVYFQQVQDLPCARDEKVFVQLFTKGMKELDYGRYETNLSVFSVEKLEGVSPTLAKKYLRTAVENWEAFMVFTAGSQFVGITKGVVSKIFGGMLREVTWEPTYIRFLLERCLALVFADVLETPVEEFREREHCGSIDISTAEGVATVFRMSLDAVTPTDTEQNYFVRHGPYLSQGSQFGGVMTAAPRWPGGGGQKQGGTGSGSSSGMGRAPTKQPQQPTSILQTGTSKTRQTNGAKGVTFQQPCMHQLMHDLQVINLSGTVCAPCRKTAWDFEHLNIKAVLTS